MIDPTAQRRKSRLVAVYLFVFSTCVYLASLSFPNVYFIDQYYPRYELTKSLVEGFDLSIPTGFGIEGVDGREYSLYGLGWSALAVPLYVLGKHLGGGPENLVSMLNPLAGAAVVSLVFLFSRALGYSIRSSLLAAVLYGFCSFAWPLAKSPFDHVVEAFFVLLSAYFMCLFLSGKRIPFLILSAVFTGMALNTRLVTALVVPALLLMMVIDRAGERRTGMSSVGLILKEVGVFLLALLPFAGIVLWYNHSRFGSPWETGFQLMASRSGLDFFSGTSVATGLAGFLVSPGKGFFFYSPVAILLFFSIVPFSRKHPAVAAGFLFAILSYLGFLSNNVYWHGDWAWGPRYLLGITPFLMIPISEFLESDRWLGATIPRTVWVSSLCGASLMIQIAGISVHPYKYFYDLQIVKGVQFDSTRLDGVPYIYEPPGEIYFRWERSPILAHAGYMMEIGSRIRDYKYEELPSTASYPERIMALPIMHLFDYWWVYNYHIFRKVSGVIVVALFLGTAAYCGFRMGVLSRRETVPGGSGKQRTMGVSDRNGRRNP